MKTITKTNGTKVTIETIRSTSNDRVTIITKTSEKIRISDSYNGHHGERIVWTAINMAGARFVKFDGQYWMVVSGAHGNGTMVAHDIISDSELADSARSIVTTNGAEVNSSSYSDVNELTIVAAYALVSGIHSDGGNVYDITEKVVAAFAAEQIEDTEQAETITETTEQATEYIDHQDEAEQQDSIEAIESSIEDQWTARLWGTCVQLALAYGDLSMMAADQSTLDALMYDIEEAVAKVVLRIHTIPATCPEIARALVERVAELTNQLTIEATDQPTMGELCDSPTELLDLLGIGWDEYDDATEDVRDAIRDIWDKLVVFDVEGTCFRMNDDIDQDETNAIIARHADRIWDEQGNVRTDEPIYRVTVTEYESGEVDDEGEYSSLDYSQHIYRERKSSINRGDYWKPVYVTLSISRDGGQSWSVVETTESDIAA